MWLNPWLATAARDYNDDAHSQPQPGAEPVGMKTAKWWGKQEVTMDIPFLNPDPMTHLVGWSNEAPITING